MKGLVHDSLLWRAATRSGDAAQRIPTALLLLVALAGPLVFARAQEPKPPSPRYEFRAQHSPDGIGKFFLGREIAQVMGHEAADWLERPERQAEERPDLLMAALKVPAGATVADIGAGTGYYSWRLAQAVGPRGRVLAEDIQPEMLERLRGELARRGFTNVVPTLGTITDPKLPANSVDVVLLVDVYHEFSDPFEMLTALTAALKPGGRIAFVEYRAEDPRVPIKLLHKMSEAQVRREAALHPLEWVETVRSLPWQHVIIFRKKPPTP